MKKSDTILFKCVIFSAILFAISVFFSPERANSPKAIDSAILNQKYKNEIKKIEIEIQNENGDREKIEIAKYDTFWILCDSERTVVSLADSKIADSLLKNAINIRKMYTVSDRIADSDVFLTNERSENSISFFISDERLVSKVYFGSEDSLKNRIYLRSHSSNTIFECENDFHQFLAADTNYWSEGKIVPEIERPVQIIFETVSETASLAKRIIDEKSAHFSSKAHTLLSLRHGEIHAGDFIDRNVQSLQKVAFLSVFDGNGRAARIEFFKRESEHFSEEDEREISYFYKKAVTPSHIDSQETSFAFFSEYAVYEISEWTFTRIFDLFLP